MPLVPVSTVHVRYLVNDVEAAIAFYTTHFGFEILTDYSPAFADVQRGNLRLLLSGPSSSAPWLPTQRRLPVKPLVGTTCRGARSR